MLSASSGEPSARHDARISEFEAQRPRLLRLGYRMLGSLSEAEDIVQEAWLRWSGVQDGIATPAAYLTRIVTRLCLDQLKSARSRRETYVGAWLPEPLMGTIEPDEAVTDDVTMTLMLALERLSPLERAAFLLHDVFEVALPEVAATLDRAPAAVRQLAVRARKHVESGRQRYRVDAAEADRIARAFFAASRDGDTAALASLLAADVELRSDGGGRVLAYPNVIHGIDRILRLFAGLSGKAYFQPVLLRTAIIDGLPGYVSADRGGVLQTTALELSDERITAIYMMRNPDKLRHVAAVLDR
ncbi:sigma-70 family RNA polymerase sigma factor [Methylobacterium oxalidis]|uniref:DNA-directed RNA polymerase sigma-70 factor n=1 Tax=Methylobacterium oxalidis TaxID=944322 RepID=A0A512JCF4_9HYPH|nr:sigma-70 family RNA polymerase sigma factor [Methylobacterium oxalidis]GEP07595.1 DNA-directed RNA polymerase sigma-70 factor [Methylobacterium oxalidis]GJE34539.1 ECF RNA polymerase sigma factor SigJ [Methylobacterium oxalidis]GLS63434.1 DNA-directed RNA polymerase sigma-70 factor [Methylobacterium oxalidis]